MIDIDVDDIIEEQKVKLIAELRKKNHFIEDYIDEDELLECLLHDCEIQGWDWEPYCSASGPSYSSGGEPASGGYYHKVIVELFEIDISEMVKQSRLDELNEELSEKKRYC